MDWKIELIPLAVEDVDRSVAFYGDKIGWTVDHDQTVHDGLRFVQVTPPGQPARSASGPASR
jgi:predicted enzyme related to lactoylglutathione lyase